ncbi:hypothetical protein HPP92_015689 [Vanilla planifolia]|uniref:K+ potassium transporter integral membrane domain-containing protein n=1 Tax=Vanilla planifolia TaxID=51239 RepID=A0A835URD8_VANPL|nr:hypothetical protein HPP92_015689 [Vanilla planifolia]
MTSYSVEDDGGRGSMWDLDQKLDQPMDEEAGRLKEMYREKRFSSLLMLRLAFQSLGVVFGDLGTSPLYVLYNTFPHGISDPQDLIGALSLIIYSLTLVPLLKYVFVVLRANDNGQVLSASGGITVNNPQISKDVVILVAVIILVGLFSMQHYGSDKVGWLFAPIVLLWFLLIGTIGAVNIWKYDTSVLKAFNPIYIVRYFKGGRRNWTSLGGILLSITGTEALFADLCHFPVLAVQIAFTLVVFPCLLLAYCGQTAYIMQHQDHVFDAFYRSIPNSIYWPMFVVATAAAIIASQATISATFSIIKQALALGCFPRVKVVHTSKKFLGQIYIPDINWILLILCIAVTAGFENKSQIGNAYGTAVVLVMLVTTLLMIPVMLLVWRSHWILIILFTALSLLVELTYFSAVIFKINQGGWVPLVIAAAFLLIMYVWHYVTVKRYEFEMHSKVSMAWILGLGPSLGLVRVPGMGFVYTELASGVPRIFSHLITNLPAIHSVVVFVCVKYLPVYRVHQGALPRQADRPEELPHVPLRCEIWIQRPPPEGRQLREDAVRCHLGLRTVRVNDGKLHRLGVHLRRSDEWPFHRPFEQQRRHGLLQYIGDEQLVNGLHRSRPFAAPGSCSDEVFHSWQPNGQRRERFLEPVQGCRGGAHTWQYHSDGSSGVGSCEEDCGGLHLCFSEEDL